MPVAPLPDPDEMNDKRASAAERALLRFARDFGEVDETGELCTFEEQNLSDLMADFAHYCDHHGLSLERCVFNGYSNYLEETDGKGRQYVFLKSFLERIPRPKR
jgi:hypothetical protein